MAAAAARAAAAFLAVAALAWATFFAASWAAVSLTGVGFALGLAGAVVLVLAAGLAAGVLPHPASPR